MQQKKKLLKALKKVLKRKADKLFLKLWRKYRKQFKQN